MRKHCIAVLPFFHRVRASGFLKATKKEPCVEKDFFRGGAIFAPHSGENGMGKAERLFFCVFSLQIVKNRL